MDLQMNPLLRLSHKFSCAAGAVALLLLFHQKDAKSRSLTSTCHSMGALQVRVSKH